MGILRLTPSNPIPKGRLFLFTEPPSSVPDFHTHPLRSSEFLSKPLVSSRSGFTLLELLLTIAVVAALAAVVIPQVSWVLGDRRLVGAADQMRVELTQLRIDAMREGRVIMLEGMIEGNTLRTRPYHSAIDSVEAIDQTGSQSALLSGANQASISVAIPDEAEETTIDLPDGITVQSVNVVSSARSLEIEQLNLSNQAEGWSQPILFYPDGTTSTAIIVFKHVTHGQIGVKLRGITGDVTIGELEGLE